MPHWLQNGGHRHQQERKTWAAEFSNFKAASALMFSHQTKGFIPCCPCIITLRTKRPRCLIRVHPLEGPLSASHG